MILKIIFTGVCTNISKRIICKHIFPSIANLKYTLHIGKCRSTPVWEPLGYSLSSLIMVLSGIEYCQSCVGSQCVV